MNNLRKTYSIRKRVILACVFIVSILSIYYWVNGKFNFDKSGSDSRGAASISSNQVSDVKLQDVSSEKFSTPISLLATSVQDKNAVVKIGATTKVISVGDVLDNTVLPLSGQTRMRVVQVAANQLVLKGIQNSDVYLVRMSKGGKPSLIEKITSDIHVDMPHSSG